jgi:hypothetical protein
VTLRSLVELTLSLGAILLLARDLRRAWLDPLRRPITLLMAALMAGLLIGAAVGPYHPSPWWLLLPGLILLWEVARGWQQAWRSHLWEAAMGAFAASFILAAVGLGTATGDLQTALLVAAAATAAGGAGLLWRSYGREPRPGRLRDADHYERRVAPRLRN